MEEEISTQEQITFPDDYAIQEALQQLNLSYDDLINLRLPFQKIQQLFKILWKDKRKKFVDYYNLDTNDFNLFLSDKIYDPESATAIYSFLLQDPQIDLSSISFASHFIDTIFEIFDKLSEESFPNRICMIDGDNSSEVLNDLLYIQDIYIIAYFRRKKVPRVLLKWTEKTNFSLRYSNTFAKDAADVNMVFDATTISIYFQNKNFDLYFISKDKFVIELVSILQNTYNISAYSTDPRTKNVYLMFLLIDHGIIEKAIGITDIFLLSVLVHEIKKNKIFKPFKEEEILIELSQFLNIELPRDIESLSPNQLRFLFFQYWKSQDKIFISQYKLNPKEFQNFMKLKIPSVTVENAIRDYLYSLE